MSTTYSQPAPQRSIELLYPDFRGRLVPLMSGMTSWCAKHLPSHKPFIFETYRSVQRQSWLYASGRSRPGPVLTYLDGVHRLSRHQLAIAADIIAIDPSRRPTWDLPDPFWDYLAHLARAFGLDSGHDWRSFKDLPHVELPRDSMPELLNLHEWIRSHHPQ